MPSTPINGLRYPSLGDPANGPVAFQNLANDLDTKVVKVCTSGTRPAGAVEGMVVYETDTDRLVTYDGAAWRYVGREPDVQIFNVNGTWTKPVGARIVWVRMVGGGGGGGAATGAGSGAAAGGGGGGGGYVEAFYLAATLGASQPVGVGGYGGGSSTAAAGITGGQSTFADSAAGGGGGGSYGGVATTGSAAGVGGGGGGASLGATAMGGYYRDGSQGGFGRIVAGQNTFTNFGGSSLWSPGAPVVSGPTTGSDATGRGYGGGGGGAYSTVTSYAGGNGASGRVIIVTF